MKAISFVPLLLTVALSLSAGQAIADEATAKANGCLACHAIDKKLVGPSYKSVATKFKGDAHAVDALTKVLRAGGKGVWGPVPMPPQTKISDADLKKVLTWILAQ